MVGNTNYSAIGTLTSDQKKPYKGPESYQVEDENLFFGRDLDAKQLTAQILSRRFTLLHAASGAGKTSLLNAKVIPSLEKRGYFPIRILPQEDPTASIRITTLKYLMPPPDIELNAIDNALAALASEKEDLILEELLTCFDALHVSHPFKRSLIAPLKVTTTFNELLFPRESTVTPFFCRLLRSSISLRSFAQHMGVLQQFRPVEERIVIDGKTSISEIRALLADPALYKHYKQFLQYLDVPAVAGLWAFFQNLVEVYGRHHHRFSLILLLDQYEELYTRFIDVDVADERPAYLPGYRLREGFLREFLELYMRSYDDAGETVGSMEGKPATILPIRFVISMRNEYIANLIDDISHVVGNMDESSFHINALRKDEAKAAIEQPARAYGYTYSDDTYQEIIEKLTRENRFVEPAHLQIVCEKLWSMRGRELSTATENRAGEEPLPQIEKEILDRLGGVKKILTSYFMDFLNSLRNDQEQQTTDGQPEKNLTWAQQEVLEMLEPLITASGTRNIVERSQLVEIPFRDAERRSLLLNKLEDQRIVRTEQRLGGYFVEITHEFLIKPVRDCLRTYLTANEVYSGFHEALRELERSEFLNFRVGTRHLLSEESFHTLQQHLDRLSWPDWAAELMLRSAIFYAADSEIIRFWANRFELPNRKIEVAQLLENIDKYEKKRRTLSLGQLWLLNSQRAALENLSIRQLEHILLSELYEAEETEREDIIYWTQQLMETNTGQDPDDSAKVNYA